MDIEWVRIASWHAVRFESRGGMRKALCGKWAPANPELSVTLPADKSCESCLRIVARLADAQ